MTGSGSDSLIFKRLKGLPTMERDQDFEAAQS